MSRTPRSVPSHARRNKVLKQAKGLRGRRKNNITTANAAVDKSLQHNYIGRKESKRNFRALWIQRINAAVPRAWRHLQPIYQRARRRRYRDRPQGAVRPRHPRARRVQGSGGSGRYGESLISNSIRASGLL